jgi:hypothetical protein
MKKVLYGYEAWGKYNINLQITLDVNREITDKDYRNASDVAEKLISSIMEESYALDPQNKIDADKERKEILDLFGDRAIFVEDIPNGYCDRYCCKHLPWFIVTTTKGKINIGWRKRVLNITWEDSIIPDDAETLFPEDNVTKFDKGIHAWGLEKAKEYIDKLLS